MKWTTYRNGGPARMKALAVLLWLLVATAGAEVLPFLFSPEVVRVQSRYGTEWTATLRNGSARRYVASAGGWQCGATVWQQRSGDWVQTRAADRSEVARWIRRGEGWQAPGVRLEMRGGSLQWIESARVFTWADRGGFWQASGGGIPDDYVRGRNR